MHKINTNLKQVNVAWV